MIQTLELEAKARAGARRLLGRQAWLLLCELRASTFQLDSRERVDDLAHHHCGVCLFVPKCDGFNLKLDIREKLLPSTRTRRRGNSG